MTITDEPICQVCNKRSKTVYRECGEFSYYRCDSCTGIFVYPIKPQKFYLETDTYLTDPTFYVNHRVNPHGQRWMIEQFERLYKGKLGKTDINGGQLLEIGAGVGYLTLLAFARGWEAQGIETSKDAVAFGKKYYLVNLEHSTIEDYKTDKTFDAIVMVEVLEHFLDPLKAVDAMRRFCGKHTLLFGTTPNTDSEHWKRTKQNIYVPDDHIFLFNERSLRRFADKAQLRDLTIEYFGGETNDSNLMYAGVLTADMA